MERIPNDVLKYVFKFLPYAGSNWINVLLTSKRFNELGNIVFLHRWRDTTRSIIGFGGRDHSQVSFGEIETYNFKTEQWTKVAPMAIRRDGHSVSVLDNNVYIIGGKTNGFTNALDQVNRYDPISGEWDVLAPLKSSRYYHSSCVVQNKIYVIGGSGKTEVEVYDTDKDTWETVDIPLAHNLACASVNIDNKIYILGGNRNPGPISSCSCIDLSTNSVASLPSLSIERSGLCGVVYNNSIYAIGGWNPANQLSSVEHFDIRENRWTTLTSKMEHKRAAFSAVLVDDYVYVAGGYDGQSTLDSVEMFDIRADKWHPAGSLTCGKQSFIMALLYTRFYPRTLYAKRKRILDDNDNDNDVPDLV